MSTTTWPFKSASKISVRLCVGLIRLYQRTLGHWLGGHCRFEPSCSEYAREAVELHGVCRGLKLAVRRFWRCRPEFGGGDDPVPPRDSPGLAPPSPHGKAPAICEHG